MSSVGAELNGLVKPPAVPFMPNGVEVVDALGVPGRPKIGEGVGSNGVRKSDAVAFMQGTELEVALEL